MFTGIIEGIGNVIRVEDSPRSRKIWIQSPFSLQKEKKGDSMAVNGCCLTLLEKKKDAFLADLSPETLEKTNLGELVRGTQVNLERPLRLQDRWGGHWVQGHVDGVCKILSQKEIVTPEEKFLFLEFELPPSLEKYVIEKGSIALEGVSLTVNATRQSRFDVCLIPHTQKLTTLTGKKPGARVNVEVDLIAKYVEKMVLKLCPSSI